MTSTTSHSTGLFYVVREPEIKTEHPPAVFLLHGVGSNEENLFSFAKRVPPEYVVVSVRAPIKLGEKRFAWYEVDFSTGRPVFNSIQEEESRLRLIQFIRDIKEKYLLNNEVYVCGFSQGAIMSYTLGLTHPDLVKGIAIMSGRLLDEIRPHIVRTDTLKGLHVLILHGTSDSVLKVDYAREAFAYLQSLGINPSYTEYKAGHMISNQMLTDLTSWLQSRYK